MDTLSDTITLGETVEIECSDRTRIAWPRDLLLRCSTVFRGAIEADQSATSSKEAGSIIKTSEVSKNIELLLEAVLGIEQGDCTVLQLPNPWDAGNIAELVLILELAQKYGVDSVLKYADMMWSMSLQVVDKYGGLKHLPKCEGLAWLHCVDCKEAHIVCSRCSQSYPARVRFPLIRCNAGQPQCGKSDHGLGASTCLCGKAIDRSAPVLLLGQLKSAIALGAVSARFQLKKTEKIIRQWLSAPLRKCVAHIGAVSVGQGAPIETLTSEFEWGDEWIHVPHNEFLSSLLAQLLQYRT